MFVRHKRKNFLRRIVDFIWPSIGFERSSKYVFYRLTRLQTSNYAIAAGFACGAAVSFSPFIGLHFILSAFFALCIRASIIASAFGTVVGNPLTFPFIWTITYKTGVFMLGAQEDFTIRHLFRNTLHAFSNMNSWYIELLWTPTQAIKNFPTYLQYWENVLRSIFPLIIGCIPWIVIVWCLFFFPLLKLLTLYQKKRKKYRKDTHKYDKNGTN